MVITNHLEERDKYHLTIFQQHWHGLSQSIAPFSDGSPQASQWPIKVSLPKGRYVTKHSLIKKKAGGYFDYEIWPKVGEAGTYFYHSHVGFQAVSAAGPLIVEEEHGKSPPFTYDEERIMFISELYNKTDSMTETELLRPYDVVQWLVPTYAFNPWSSSVETDLRIFCSHFPGLVTPRQYW
jgi:FtsP/CotA-like multicopper oxidase with cupredoxin domain